MFLVNQLDEGLAEDGESLYLPEHLAADASAGDIG